MEEQEDLGGKFVIAVEDISGVWKIIKPILEQHSALQGLTLRNKFGNAVDVPQLPIEYALSTDPMLVRLRPHSQNPVAWFRNPYAHLIVVSCEELTDYRASLRSQLRMLLEREKDPVLGMVEWIVLYVRPLHTDVNSRGPKRVFEKLRDDFNTKKRDRCVRLDTPMVTGQNSLVNGPCEGLEELETFLKESVCLSFEARQSAYEEEVRRLMLARKDPGWSFPTFFLVKDSLAIMLEAATLHEDALREYYELEACYLEALGEGGALKGGEFGGSGPGDDVASLLNSSWRETRRAILNYGSISQFHFRQFLFARQGRLLLTLQRPLELADRAMKFVQAFSSLLYGQSENGELPERLREVWVFSACLSVTSVTYREMYGGSDGQEPRLHPSPIQLSRTRPRTEVPALDPLPAPDTPAAAPQRAPQAPAVAASSPGVPPRPPPAGGPAANTEASSPVPSRLLPKPSRLGSPSKASSPGSAARAALPRIRVRAEPDQQAEGTPGAEGGLGAPVDEGEGDEWSLTPETDWDLGIIPEFSQATLEAAEGAGGSAEGFLVPQTERNYFCVIGHLYSSARAELVSLGKQLGLQTRVQQSPFSSSSIAAGSPVTTQHGSPAGHITSINAIPSPVPSPVPSPLPSALGAKASTANQNMATIKLRRASSPRAISPGHAPPSTSTLAPRSRPSSPGIMRFASPFSSRTSAGQPEEPYMEEDLDTASGARIDSTSSAALAKLRSEESTEDLSIHRSNSATTLSGTNGMSLIEEAEARSPPPVYAPSDHLSTAASATAAELELDVPEEARATESAAPPAAPPLPTQDPPEEPVTPKAPEDPKLDPPVADTKDTRGTAASSAGIPAWLTEWRLQEALSTKDKFEELFIQLSIAAAHCYSLSGRQRNATMIRADVAALLLKTGRLRAAAALYQKQAQIFAREGWHALLAQALPSLIMCLKTLKHPAVPHWTAKLLSLPPVLMPHVDRSLLQRELEAGAGRAEVVGAAARASTVALLAMPGRQYGQPELAPDFYLQRGVPGAQAVMDAVGVLILSPAPGRFTRAFAGRPADPSAPGEGDSRDVDSNHIRICVGDVAELQVEVWSNLPHPLALSEVTVTLAVLATAGDHAAGQRPVAGKGAEPSWAEVGLLHCPLQESIYLEPGANAVTFPAYPVQPGRYSLKHMAGRLGNMTLCVRVCTALPRGAAKWALAEGQHGGRSLLAIPEAAVTPRGSFRSLSRSAAMVAAMGDTSQVHDGEVMEEQMVLEVQRNKSRLVVAAVAFQGGLSAGQSQWMGIKLQPAHDQLKNATLQVWTLPRRQSNTLASVSFPRRASYALAIPADMEPQPSEEAPDGSPARSPHPEEPSPVWVKVVNGCMKLPPWASTHTSIIWMWIQSGQPETLPKTIRMSSIVEGPRRFHSTHFRRLQSQASVSAAGAAPSLGPVDSTASTQTALGLSMEAQAAEAESHAELEVEVRYTSGCNRSHSCILSLPVFQPFSVDVAAHRLQSGRVVVEVSLRSCLVKPAVVQECNINLQRGLALDSSWAQVAGLLPASVGPEGTLKLLYFVRQTDSLEVETSEDDLEGPGLEHHTTFEAIYEILPSQPHSLPREVAAEAPRRIQFQPGPEVSHLPPENPPSWHVHAGDEQCPIGGTANAQAAGLDSAATFCRSESLPDAMRLTRRPERHTLRETFSIDTGLKEVSPDMVVIVRMLGPFTMTQGQPTHFCWRLERAGTGSPHGVEEAALPRSVSEGSGQPAVAPGKPNSPPAGSSRFGKSPRAGGRNSASAQDETVMYEVSASGEAWKMSGRRGQVWLPRRHGATATIEAIGTPLMDGRLPLPDLQLRGVVWREEPAVEGPGPTGADHTVPTHCLVGTVSGPPPSVAAPPRSLSTLTSQSSVVVDVSSSHQAPLQRAPHQGRPASASATPRAPPPAPTGEGLVRQHKSAVEDMRPPPPATKPVPQRPAATTGGIKSASSSRTSSTNVSRVQSDGAAPAKGSTLSGRVAAAISRSMSFPTPPSE